MTFNLGARMMYELEKTPTVQKSALELAVSLSESLEGVLLKVRKYPRCPSHRSYKF